MPVKLRESGIFHRHAGEKLRKPALYDVYGAGVKLDMTQTIVIPVVTGTELIEFTIPCVHLDCARDATWIVRSTHGEHCPQDGAVCDICKARLEVSWRQAIRDTARCANCHVDVTGQLSDHLRFIRL